MKCPLLKITRPGLMPEDVHPQDDCLKEECAWWEPNDAQCSIVVLAQFIAGIGCNIKDIKDKMLHVEQLKK